MSASGTTPQVEGPINDKSIAELRSWIGRARPARGWNSAVTQDAVWHFAAGVGDDNPLWWDSEYCERTARGRMFAPPTFLYSCNNAPELPGEDRLHPSEHWLPGTRTLWLGDRWEFRRRAWVGEGVRAVEELVDVVESTSRSGKRVVTHTDRTTFFGTHTDKTTFFGPDDVIATCEKTVLRTERPASSGITPVDEARYDADEVEGFAAQFAKEVDSRRGSSRLTAADVRVGTSLGPILKGPLTRTSVVGWVLGWGSPMCLTNRMQHEYLANHPGSVLLDEHSNIKDSLEATHWDDDRAVQVGLPRAYDLGPQRISWVAHLVTDWMGDDAFLSSLEARLLRPNLIGDITWLRGEVVATTPGESGTEVTCAIEGHNQRGEHTIQATATISVPGLEPAPGDREA